MSSTGASDPLLNSRDTASLCTICRNKEASLICDSCRAQYCRDCSKDIHKIPKNRNHRVMFIDARRRADSTLVSTTPPRRKREEDLDEIYSRIGSALGPESSSSGTPYKSVGGTPARLARKDSEPEPLTSSQHYRMRPMASADVSPFGKNTFSDIPDMAISPTTTPISAQSSSGMASERHIAVTINGDGQSVDAETIRELEAKQKRKRILITVTVLLSFLGLSALRSFYISLYLLYGDTPVSIFPVMSDALRSFAFLGIRFGLFLPICLLVWIVQCTLIESLRKSVLNPFAMMSASCLALSFSAFWWVTQYRSLPVDNDVWYILFCSSVLVVGVPSVFLGNECVGIRTGVMCFNVAVGSGLAYWNTQDTFAVHGGVLPVVLLVFAGSILPAFYIFFLRKSVLEIGSSKTLFAQSIVILLFCVPLSAVFEKDLLTQVFNLDHGYLIRLVCAVVIDFTLIGIATVAACLLELMMLAFFFHWLAVATSPVVLVSITVWHNFGWNLYHIAALVLLGLSIIYFSVDLRAYLQRRNRFL